MADKHRANNGRRDNDNKKNGLSLLNAIILILSITATICGFFLWRLADAKAEIAKEYSGLTVRVSTVENNSTDIRIKLGSIEAYIKGVDEKLGIVMGELGIGTPKYSQRIP